MMKIEVECKLSGVQFKGIFTLDDENGKKFINFRDNEKEEVIKKLINKELKVKNYRCIRC